MLASLSPQGERETNCRARMANRPPKVWARLPLFLAAFLHLRKEFETIFWRIHVWESRDGPPMSPPHRTPITRPALWIAVPTFVVSLAVAARLAGRHLRRAGGGPHRRRAGRRLRRSPPHRHHLLDRPHRPRRPLHLAARTGRRRRHPAVRRHRGNGARRADRGRYGQRRPEPARDRSAAASRRPAVLHRQFPPRGGRSGQHLHQCRRAHPAHRHRARREQPRHGAAGDGGLRRRSSSRRGSRRRRRRGARRRDAGDEFGAAGGRGARGDQAHQYRAGARRRHHAHARRGGAAHREGDQAHPGHRRADFAAWRSTPLSKRRAPANPGAASPWSPPR